MIKLGRVTALTKGVDWIGTPDGKICVDRNNVEITECTFSQGNPCTQLDEGQARCVLR